MKTLFAVNNDAYSEVLLGNLGKHVTVAVEDVQKSIAEESYANAVQSTIYSFDGIIKDTTPDVSGAVTKSSNAGTEK